MKQQSHDRKKKSQNVKNITHMFPIGNFAYHGCKISNNIRIQQQHTQFFSF